MGVTTVKGEIGEAMVIADLKRRGFGIAIPFGHDVPFDGILYRKETGTLERVQVKYTESDGKVVKVKCRSASDWVAYRYTARDVDWLAAYDATTDCCYYVPSSVFDGMCDVTRSEQVDPLGARLSRAEIGESGEQRRTATISPSAGVAQG